MTVLFGAEATSIAVPRSHLTPLLMLSRTVIVPELLIVRTSVASGGVPVLLVVARMPYAVAAPPPTVMASTVSVPEFETTMLFTPETR